MQYGSAGPVIEDLRPWEASLLRASLASTSSAEHRRLAMNSPGSYLQWGVVQISWANLIVILLMLVVFGLALFLPFPGGRQR